MTLKGIVAVALAGVAALVAQLLGVDLTALAGGGEGTETASPPADTRESEAPPKKKVTPPNDDAKKGESPKEDEPAEKAEPEKRDDTDEIRKLFRAMRSDVQVEAEGEVVLLMKDDLHGSKHQLFLVELSNGITVKVSHNIDIAPRVPLEKGDTIRFHGEYEYNEKGGVVHWTHRTLGSNPHPHGWLLHEGKKYD